MLCRAIATPTKLRCEESILWMVSIAKRRTMLRRDRDVDKMPNVTKSESRESLLAMPSPSNVMEHKEMLIWHKET